MRHTQSATAPSQLPSQSQIHLEPQEAERKEKPLQSKAAISAASTTSSPSKGVTSTTGRAAGVAPTGFAIFVDEPLTSARAQNDNVEGDKRSKKNDKKDVSRPHAKSETSSLGFTIFSDSNVTSEASKTVKELPKKDKKRLLDSEALSRKIVDPIEIQSNLKHNAKAEQSVSDYKESKVSTVVSLATNEESEGVSYDAEDSTINTKLARHDIDSMFFSPSAGETIAKRTSSNRNQPTSSSSLLVKAVVRDPSDGHQKQLPLGVRVEELTGIKDLSAIKEVLQLSVLI